MSQGPLWRWSGAEEQARGEKALAQPQQELCVAAEPHARVCGRPGHVGQEAEGQEGRVCQAVTADVSVRGY